MLATKLRKTSGPAQLRPKTLNQLRRFLQPESGTPLPIRPQGAGTAATDCNTADAGSILHMTHLDRVFLIDTERHTVTVEAGIRIEAYAQVWLIGPMCLSVTVVMSTHPSADSV